MKRVSKQLMDGEISIFFLLSEKFQKSRNSYLYPCAVPDLYESHSEIENSPFYSYYFSLLILLYRFSFKKKIVKIDYPSRTCSW